MRTHHSFSWACTSGDHGVLRSACPGEGVVCAHGRSHSSWTHCAYVCRPTKGYGVRRDGQGSPVGEHITKEVQVVPGAIWPGTTSYIIQSLEKHIHCLEKNTQSDLYTITELQQRNTRL